MIEPLKGKAWNGICPIGECKCVHQDEYNWYADYNVTLAVEWLLMETYTKMEVKKIDDDFYLKSDDVRTKIKEAFEDVMGTEK